MQYFFFKYKNVASQQSILSVTTRSQMISQEDFSVISRLDSGDQASGDKVVKHAPLLKLFVFRN